MTRKKRDPNAPMPPWDPARDGTPDERRRAREGTNRPMPRWNEKRDGNKGRR